MAAGWYLGVPLKRTKCFPAPSYQDLLLRGRKHELVGHDVRRPPAAREKLELVVAKQLDKHHLDGVAGEEAAGTRRPAIAKIQARWGRCLEEEWIAAAAVDSTGLALPGHLLLALLLPRAETAQAVEAIRVRRVRLIVLDGVDGHACVGAGGNMRAVGEGVSAHEDALHADDTGRREPLRLAHHAVHLAQPAVGVGSPAAIGHAGHVYLVQQLVSQVVAGGCHIIQHADDTKERRVYRGERQQHQCLRDGVWVTILALSLAGEPRQHVVFVGGVIHIVQVVVSPDEVRYAGTQEPLCLGQVTAHGAQRRE